MTRPLEATGRTWFIQAAGRVWGPYPESRLASFVDEGRVAPETLVGPAAEGPFAPAAHQARLTGLFGDVRVEVPDEEERVDEPRARAETAAARPLLVWAELKSRRIDRLESLIGAYGPFVRIEPGLWLVRARMGAAGLRNALTRRLAAEDRLMVLSAPLKEAAWFNLDGETDRMLRQLWMNTD